MRRIGRAALRAVGYATAGLLLAEILVRVVGLSAGVSAAPAMIENEGKTYGLECYPTDPRGELPIDLSDAATRRRVASESGLGLDRLEQAAATLPHCVAFRYNEHTYRDGPFVPDPPGVRTVLVVGDSFAEGAGVTEERTFPRRLEALLARGEAGRMVRVRNGGRRGRDQPAILEATERLLPLVEPEVVVYALVLNDFEQDAAYRERQAFLNDLILDRQHMGSPTFGLPAPLRHSRLASVAAERWRSYRVATETVRWYQGMTGPENRLGWERTQRDLERMRRAVAASGGELLVATLPLLFGLEGGAERYPFLALHRDVAGACERLGIAHVDLLGVFLGAKSRDLWVHEVDMHPNEIGHERIARGLEPAVRAALARSTERPRRSLPEPTGSTGGQEGLR